MEIDSSDLFDKLVVKLFCYVCIGASLAGSRWRLEAVRRRLRAVRLVHCAVALAHLAPFFVHLMHARLAASLVSVGEIASLANNCGISGPTQSIGPIRIEARRQAGQSSRVWMRVGATSRATRSLRGQHWATGAHQQLVLFRPPRLEQAHTHTHIHIQLMNSSKTIETSETIEATSLSRP